MPLTQPFPSDIPPSPVARSYYIHTFGCQMNESDSQRMGEALARAGWAATDAPDGADLIVVNTCAIREKAEDKLFSALGRYRLLKARRGTKIGVAGCVAQREESKLLQRAPDRVVAAVFHQTVGDRPEDPGIMCRHSTDNWLPDFRARRPEVSQDTIDKYFHSLWRVQPDFLYSVPREFIKNCHTPILVLPDDTPSHPLQTSIDVASLAPNSEITVFPWREPEELRQRIIQKVRTFLKSHLPMRAAAQ